MGTYRLNWTLDSHTGKLATAGGNGHTAHEKPEAEATLASTTWERARRNPTAYTAWLLDIWDRRSAALTAPQGPLAGCTPRRHDSADCQQRGGNINRWG